MSYQPNPASNIWYYFSLWYSKMLKFFVNYAKWSLTACLKILRSDPRNRYPKLKSPSAQHLLSTGTTGWSHCCQANACEEEVKTRKTPPRKGQELPVLLFHRELHGGGRPSAAELEPHSRYVRTRILAFFPSTSVDFVFVWFEAYRGGKARPRTMTHTLPSTV